MSREQEHVLNACLLPSLQKALGTIFRRTEQSKCIGNLPRSILRNCRGIVVLLKLESSFFQPVKIRGARISKKGSTRSEPASHPSRPCLGGSQTERNHEHHRKIPQGAVGPRCPLLQVTKRCADRCRMQTDHEKGAVGNLAGKFDHARPGGEQIDRRGRRGSIPKAGWGRAELDALPGEEPADIADRFTHHGHGCMRFAPGDTGAPQEGEQSKAVFAALPINWALPIPCRNRNSRYCSSEKPGSAHALGSI